MTKLIIPVLCFIVGCTPPTNNATDTTSTIAETSTQSGREYLGAENARKKVLDVIKGANQPLSWDTLIKTSSTAIAIAEPILFDVYGKEQILEEKPYQVYLIDGFWCISGTIPKGWKGGGFEIIISAKDAKVIWLTHYK